MPGRRDSYDRDPPRRSDTTRARPRSPPPAYRASNNHDSYDSRRGDRDRDRERDRGSNRQGDRDRDRDRDRGGDRDRRSRKYDDSDSEDDHRRDRRPTHKSSRDHSRDRDRSRDRPRPRRARSDSRDDRRPTQDRSRSYDHRDNGTPGGAIDVKSVAAAVVKAAIAAGAVEAFKQRRKPGSWVGEKGVRVAGAAISAATINAAVDKGKNGGGGQRKETSKKSAVGATVAGLVMNQLLSGQKKR